MAPPLPGQENFSASAAVLVLNLLGAPSFKKQEKGPVLTGLLDVHRHSGSQAEESRIELLPKAGRLQYTRDTRQRRIIID